MNLITLLSSHGRYSRVQYNISEFINVSLNIGLLLLVFVHLFYIILAIPGCIFLWFIHIQATIKRLRDLGRTEDDCAKLLIPFVGTFLDWKLHYQAGRNDN